jgi:hypothetical protein
LGSPCSAMSSSRVVCLTMARCVQRSADQLPSCFAADMISLDRVATVGFRRFRFATLDPAAAGTIVMPFRHPYMQRRTTAIAACGSTDMTRQPRRWNDAVRSPTCAPMSPRRRKRLYKSIHGYVSVVVGMVAAERSCDAHCALDCVMPSHRTPRTRAAPRSSL